MQGRIEIRPRLVFFLHDHRLQVCQLAAKRHVGHLYKAAVTAIQLGRATGADTGAR